MIFLQAKWLYFVRFNDLNLRLREILCICWLPIHWQLYSDLTCQGRNIKIDKTHWRKFSICWKQLGEEYWDTTHNFLHEGVNTIYFNMQMNNERLKRDCWLQKTQTWHTLYIVNEILAPKLFSTQKQKQGTIVGKALDGQRYPMP